MFWHRGFFFVSYLSALSAFCTYSVLTFAIEVQQPASTVAPPSEQDAHELYSADDYNKLREKILIGRATLYEVKQALTEKDPYALTNTIHGLFAMRWHRGVYHLLHDMWNKPQSLDSQLARQAISSAPARIALASTINRIEIVGTDEQLSYIRSYKDDPHEFNRAQVVIALGLNGYLADIQYIKLMADSENWYVAQSAITSLALMGGKKARNAMIDLWEKYQDSSKGQLLKTLLKKAYQWVPVAENISVDKNTR